MPTRRYPDPRPFLPYAECAMAGIEEAPLEVMQFALFRKRVFRSQVPGLPPFTFADLGAVERGQYRSLATASSRAERRVRANPVLRNYYESRKLQRDAGVILQPPDEDEILAPSHYVAPPAMTRADVVEAMNALDVPRLKQAPLALLEAELAALPDWRFFFEDIMKTTERTNQKRQMRNKHRVLNEAIAHIRELQGQRERVEYQLSKRELLTQRPLTPRQARERDIQLRLLEWRRKSFSERVIADMDTIARLGRPVPRAKVHPLSHQLPWERTPNPYIERSRKH